MKYDLEQLINHVNLSVENSNNNISKLTSEILSMDGMTGIKTRHLYNNICSLDGANYLEIGTWMGSSFISAFYENNINPNIENPTCENTLQRNRNNFKHFTYQPKR